MLDAIAKYILGEFQTIMNAPASFFLVLLAGCAVIWWLMSWRYAGVIANRDSEISSLRTQRDEYKDKAGGASPDEVKSKLGELAEMSRYTVGAKWPPLTDRQIAELGMKFAEIPKRRIQVMYSNYRGKDLAQNFADILKQAGWTDIHFSEGGGLGFGVSTGRGDGAAIALKKAIEQATEFKVGSFGPDEPDASSVCFIAVGINTA
jgi:hypothetical protein